jgi:hypothetical protein
VSGHHGEESATGRTVITDHFDFCNCQAASHVSPLRLKP